MKIKNLILMGAAFALAACAGSNKDPEELIGDVSDLYNQGADAMEAGNYTEALHAFSELERQHPYSGWATRAHIMTTYAHFKIKDYDETILSADRFLRLHPGHEDADYMYYLKGLSYYNRISDVKRDQGYTKDAMEAFQELVSRYPESDYAQDADLKMTLCRDHMAGQEMMVGRFYQEQKRYLAAINRFKRVIEDYEKSTHTPEALFRLSESYMALGVKDEAERSAAILGFNFPDSKWYADAYKMLQDGGLKPPAKGKSWFGQIGKGVKDMF